MDADQKETATGSLGEPNPGGDDAPAAAAAPGPDAAAAPGPDAAGPPAAPSTTLTCPSCGRKNRIKPSPRGTPHCGSCDARLPWVVDATDETFGLEAASSVAVLVDLWAPWCGPCRYVSPMLEELARDYAGRLKVVKVNVDENQRLAAVFQARSIPTLVVIRDGRVVDRVVGAVPKADLTARLMPYLLKR
jgi:thioredoxin 2